jgi:hypothetical protein
MVIVVLSKECIGSRDARHSNLVYILDLIWGREINIFSRFTLNSITTTACEIKGQLMKAYVRNHIGWAWTAISLHTIVKRMPHNGIAKGTAFCGLERAHRIFHCLAYSGIPAAVATGGAHQGNHHHALLYDNYRPLIKEPHVHAHDCNKPGSQKDVNPPWKRK